MDDEATMAMVEAFEAFERDTKAVCEALVERMAALLNEMTEHLGRIRSVSEGTRPGVCQTGHTRPSRGEDR